jgi:hypothetical protein
VVQQWLRKGIGFSKNGLAKGSRTGQAKGTILRLGNGNDQTFTMNISVYFQARVNAVIKEID